MDWKLNLQNEKKTGIACPHKAHVRRKKRRDKLFQKVYKIYYQCHFFPLNLVGEIIFKEKKTCPIVIFFWKEPIHIFSYFVC